MSHTIDQHGTVSEAPVAIEQAIRQVQEGWNQAAATWDVEGLVAQYTEDVLMFGGRPGHSVGLAGMRAYFGSYAGQLSFAQLELVDQYVVTLSPDRFLTQGFGVFKFRLGDGRHTGTTMRTTLMLERRDGRWKIQQHHFSTIPDQPPIHG